MVETIKPVRGVTVVDTVDVQLRCNVDRYARACMVG